MGLSLQRVNDGVTYIASLVVTGIGVTTVSEKVAIGGLLIGALTGWRAWVHRRRIEQAEIRRNELIAQILERSQGALSGPERDALRLAGGSDDEKNH